MIPLVFTFGLIVGVVGMVFSTIGSALDRLSTRARIWAINMELSKNFRRRLDKKPQAR